MPNLLDGLDTQLPQLPQAPVIPNDYAALAQQAGQNAAGTLGAGNPAGNIGMSYTPMVNFQNQQAAFGGAMGLAGLKAQIAQQQAQEYQAGAPGRMANIQTGTAEAQDRLKMEQSGLPLQEEIAARVAKMSQDKQNEIQAKDYIWSAIAHAKPEDVPQLLDQFGDDASINGKKLKDMPPDVAQKLAAGIEQGLYQTSRIFAGERGKTIAGQYQVEAWKSRGINAAEIAAKAKIQVQEMKDQVSRGMINASMAKQSLQQRVREMIDQGRQAGASETQIQMAIQPYLDAATTIASAGVNAKAQATERLFQSAFGGNPQATPGPNAAITPPVVPNPAPAKPSYQKGKLYVDKNGNKAMWDGTKFVPQ